MANLDERLTVAKGTCSVESCDKSVRARGWCRSHYDRWRAMGLPDAESIAARERSWSLLSEQWLPVVGHPGYEVSDYGRVRSLDRITHCSNGVDRQCRGQILKPMIPAGYARVRLGRKWRSVHHLVLEAFIGPCPSGYQCCHDNGDSTDNRLFNLRWDTVSANQFDRVRHGTHQEAAKTHCRRGHPLEAPNLGASELRNGKRICLACRRTHSLILQRKAKGQPVPDFKSLSDAYYLEIVNGSKVSRRVAQRLEAIGKSGDQHLAS